MKFGTDIHGPQRMNYNDFGDSPTFVTALTAIYNFHLSSQTSQHLLEG